MSAAYSDRYEQAPREGEFFDRKGFVLLKQYRTWAKAMTIVMSVILLAAMIHAMITEQPGLFFIIFFIFVVILGITGISYDHLLQAHKLRVSEAKEQKRRILMKSILIRKKRLDMAREKSEERAASS